MAVDKTLIGNLALSAVGTRSKIESLTERSAEADAINLWFTHSLRTALEYSDWSFARKRKSLALDEDAAPESEWAFRYAYPADCVKARRMENPLRVGFQYNYYSHTTFRNQFISPDAVPYEIEFSEDGERKTILTNLENARLVYTFYHERFNQMPTKFINGLAFMIAGNIATTITSKPGIQDAMMKQGERTLGIAAGYDANENVEDEPRDTDWIRGRY